jgi:predicted tellurium resistance membrane protein TerC
MKHGPCALTGGLLMTVPVWLWFATVAGLLVLIGIDLVIVDRKPHEVTSREAARWVLCYVSCAILFGAGVWFFAGHDYGAEFFTSYLTEYSLSVDNLFIFMVIMASFHVPAIHQHRVLLIGIVLALALRSVFIAIGAALIAQFVWVFFLFGAMLFWTAVNTARGIGEQDEYRENALTRWARRRRITPLSVAIVAIGSADLVFAVDSIPAIFGITQKAFLVFTANAFALMGLRQLFFLLGRLVDKLVYLPFGLAVILAFIGAKLVLHALHEYHAVPGWLDIGNWVSLGVIVAVLTITVAASRIKGRRDATPAQLSGSVPATDTGVPVSTRGVGSAAERRKIS